ncbi:MAG: sulfatase-like hydrolase/transferase [Acidobacteria bacterium]|nr:sulfatase-like hydrolase/transferase [Acidobacteriota bacterium]
MHRRQFLQTATGAAALARSQAALSRPNVLIFLADDLGWHDVGYHGSEIRTPNIDRLAAQGTRFERAYSFPVCSPTRSGLMTGRSPMRLGVAYTVIRPWSDYGVPVRERFMPQAFQAAGYQTAITGKWHLGHAYKKFLPRARGFDHAYGHVNGAIDYFTHEREGGLDWSRNGKSVREEGYSTFLLGAEASRFIKQRDRNRPFFLYLPFNAPHAPLQAPPEYIDKYANIRDEKRRRYAAMTDAMDATVGKVLATLDEEGVAGNTLVLFFSDNGGPTGSGATNTPLRAGKATTFEGGTRVPAILRWPGHLKAGGVSQQVMSMMDHFPTLAAAAGVTPGNTLPFDGKNLWPAITSGKAEPRDDIFFAIGTGGMTRLAVHRREWKLVREIPRSGAPKDLLFRIDEDPTESNDLSAKNPKLVADLTRAIEEWRATHPADGVTESNSVQRPGWKAPELWIEAAREG